jgi:hypothetical protein
VYRLGSTEILAVRNGLASESVIFSAALGPFWRGTRRSTPSFFYWIIESSLALCPPAPAVFAVAQPSRAAAFIGFRRDESAACKGTCGGWSGQPKSLSGPETLGVMRWSPQVRQFPIANGRWPMAEAVVLLDGTCVNRRQQFSLWTRWGRRVRAPGPQAGGFVGVQAGCPHPAGR